MTGESLPTPELPARACGRCRQLFDGDPELHPQALAEWWVCTECRAALFGTTP